MLSMRNHPHSGIASWPTLLTEFIDPFEDDLLGETETVGSQKDNIHIRIQQRNGKKTLTTLQGLGEGVWLVL